MVEKALSQYGIRERQGTEINSLDIVGYFKEIGHSWVKTDETAWCSAFVNWVAKTSGYEYSGKLNARSWLEAGRKTAYPQMGDIVVLWRVSKNDWRCHVGFFVRESNNFIWILGGNQDNSVCIKAYPKERLLQYRRLNKFVP